LLGFLSIFADLWPFIIPDPLRREIWALDVENPISY